MVPKEAILWDVSPFEKKCWVKEWNKNHYDRIIDILRDISQKQRFSSFVAQGRKTENGKETDLVTFYFDTIEKINQFFQYNENIIQRIQVIDDTSLQFFECKDDANYMYAVCCVNKKGNIYNIGKDVRKAYGFNYKKGRRLKRG